jgi:hypothetical protein
MASNEGHIHWSGDLVETVNYLGQDLTIRPGLKRGGVTIRGTGETTLTLPNSSSASPQWSPIPGTNPVLEARVEPHYPTGYIRVRQQ